MHTTAEHDSGDLWVFGYGSLMWRPGFAYLERVPARLVGLHRALCVFSFVHRGTPERPGLVLGLDRGGMCRGIAYRVAATKRAETIGYLRAREQVTTVYLETMRQIELEDRSRRRVRALCYVVDRSHVQYAGRLASPRACITCGRAMAAPAQTANTCSKRCGRSRRSAIVRANCICSPSGSPGIREQ